MSAPRNLTFVAGLSRGTEPPLGWQPPRCALSPGPAGGGLASAEAGPWPRPLSLAIPAAAMRGHRTEPGGRDVRPCPRSQDDPGGRLQACGAGPGAARAQRPIPRSAPQPRRCAPRAARGSPAPPDTRHRRALIGQHRRPRLPSRGHSEDSSAHRPRIAAADWLEAAVSHVEGRAAPPARPRPPP